MSRTRRISGGAGRRAGGGACGAAASDESARNRAISFFMNPRRRAAAWTRQARVYNARTGTGFYPRVPLVGDDRGGPGTGSPRDGGNSPAVGGKVTSANVNFVRSLTVLSGGGQYE